MIELQDGRKRGVSGFAFSLVCIALVSLLSHAAETPPSHAQSPTATPTNIPVPPPAVLPNLSGEWSITRSWYRGCPGCGMPVTLSSTWVISQTGSAVRMKQGPSGELVADGVGGYRLRLEGLEQSGPLTLRFFYAGLRVSADGLSLEGGLSGSERLQNPCGERPVVVTCFANAGYLRATRIGGATPIPPVTLAPPAPSSTMLPSPSATEPPSSTPRPSPTSTATPSPSASPSPTSRPPLLFLPRVWRDG